jgi:hypothetical protein
MFLQKDWDIDSMNAQRYQLTVAVDSDEFDVSE